MQWSDEGIIISMRKYGENAGILTLFTPERGVHGGMVRSAFSARQRGNYQPATIVKAHWNGRLEGHLGNYSCETVQSIAACVLHDVKRLAALNAVLSLVESAIPEREPHPEFYDMLKLFLQKLASDDTPEIAWHVEYMLLELSLLTHMGFGLDLSACAVTGAVEELWYVSPKSGRAVCKTAGEPYKDKLLPLPLFLHHEVQEQTMRDEIHKGFVLTRYFLNRYIYQPRNKPIPTARERLVELLRE